MEEQGSPVSSETVNLLTETLAPEMDNEPEQNPQQNGVSGGGSGLKGTLPVVEMKRKRGRPKKYDFLGGGAKVSHVSSSPGPESMASLSLFSSPSIKRGRGRPRGSGRLQQLASLGGLAVDTAGGSFTPHVITVQTGEDVVSKIISFSERGPRAVCVLSATGVVCNVTIGRPSGAFIRHEGLFEILSLSGSHVFTSTSGPLERKKGMLSASLAKPDGRVFGGGVVSSMTAACPIQLIVASFKQDIRNQLRRLSAESAVAANVLSSPDLVRVPVVMAPTDIDESTLTSNQQIDHNNLLNVGQNAFQAMADERTSPDNKSNFAHL